MPTTKLCLIRHGETAWNTERRLQGHTDIPLNAKGALQARQMAQALKDINLTFDVLYTSDLKRAADTANAVVELFGVEANVDSAFRERHFGALQGMSTTEAPLLRPDIWQAHISRDLEHDLEGGESIGQFALRVQNALDKIKVKTTLAERRNLEEVANALLKDTGIKTAIIREYLPVMNKLINKYLNAMDAYIHFELDESFNESVKSRFRDDFTYASFSEGEKMRIDLAILFTWRQVAKMKNSVNTNLLLLDEIFDSSLDTAGTDYFLNLMNSFGENSNIFVISHKGDQLFDKFRSVIKFEKRNDFSVIATQ